MTGARPMLDPRVVAAFRRDRITGAMAELCMEHGYRATTIDDVARHAGVSRATVYANFNNRGDVFLTLLDGASQEIYARAEAACQAAGADPQQRIEAALAAVLAFTAEQPAASWACLVEALCATPESLKRYHETLSRFTALLRQAIPSNAVRPETIEESLVGGVASVLSHMIRSGETERAPGLLADLSALLLAPYFFAAAQKGAPAAAPKA